jgi:ectoine hydroxylase-related dioxygenase (phytanoyl-CoA dioxygenase family)
MITITLDGPFNDPMVYAPAFVMPVIKRLLGDDAILGSFVAVTSLAGSEEQHTHRDMPLLFGDDQLGAAVPAYCLTLVIPFVDMNDVNGTTAFLAGSHHAIGEEPAGIEPQAPDVGIGDVMLFDCRVWHFGTPNRSNAPRPVLYNSYQRPWFRDAINFDLQAPLTVSQRALDQVPDEHRHLFEWAMKPR